MTNPTSVQFTADNYLCNSCAACKSICPQKAIDMVETPSGQLIPSINSELCNSCKKCISVCQGYQFVKAKNFLNINNIFYGDAICGFIGKSNDEYIYANSQSGGVATTLALNLLEDEEIDGVLVTAMTSKTPLRPYPVLAKNREQILLSQKSKYCPTPLLENIHQTLIDSNKIAMIGLPCHIHAVMNICDANPKLKDKIKYKIGLICDRVMTYTAIDYLLNTSIAKQNKEVTFNFRNKSSHGYPGDVIIKSDSESHVLPAYKRMEIKDYFTPPRCLLCFDKMNIFSDITLGDPHGLQNYDNARGETAIVARNKQGLALIANALKNGIIKLRDIPAQSIFEGQQIESYKKRNWLGYTREWRELGLPLPTTYKDISMPRVDNDSKHRAQIIHSLNIAQCKDKTAIISNAYKKFKHKNNNKKIVNIEIKGVGFVNKGAELMLESILQHYSKNNYKFVMEPISYNSTYEQRARKGIYQKLSIDGNLITGIPEQICKLYGLVSDDEVHAVLDASGFCYGEQWGDALTQEMARRIHRWKLNGAKVILLPQAFGPFRSEPIRTAMRSIVTNADVIFARDKESYAHIRSLDIPCNNVQISPDFTSITKGIKPNFSKKLANKICIIPNAMIYKKIDKKLSENYINILNKIIETAHINGKECFILIHEGHEDLKIGIKLQQSSRHELSIITEPDPLRVKGIIGECYAVVSSRFHGIVSALSQSIPTLCTGWSHKYKMLMEDYDCPECLIELSQDMSEIEKKAFMIIDKEHNTAIITKLKSNSLMQKELVYNMWNKVDSIITN